MFHLERNLKVPIFVSFDDINITKYSSCCLEYIIYEYITEQFYGRCWKCPSLLEDKHPPEILLPVSVLLPYSLLPCQDEHL
jgi:hypothetical protein